MIISRTPFRISFAGGGSDLPSFYKRETGAVLSTSIDKYMYIAIHPYFERNKIQLKYSKTEQVDSIDAIRHPIFKEVLKMYNLTGVDLNSIADIPSGTGLGSSSSFTVGLLNAVRAYLGKATSGERLGELACDVEINRVGSPIGKQDQYAAACGGLNFITFYGDETVNVEKIIMQPDKKKELEDNLLMVFVGGEHSANAILKNQQAAISDGFRQWADEVLGEGSEYLDKPVKADLLLGLYKQETNSPISPKGFTEQLMKWCKYASHIACFNPASKTNQKTDGDRWYQYENGKKVKFYFIQTVTSAHQVVDQELPF